MKQSTKRFISMILGLVFLVAALIIYFDFIQPVYEDAQKLKAEQLSLDNFLNNEKEAIAKVQNLISAYQGQGALQQALSSSFPEEEDSVGALAQLYGLTQNQNGGLSLQSVSLVSGGGEKPGQAGGGASFTKPKLTSVLQVKLIGPYEELKTFLIQLETNMRIFDLKSLTIGQNSQQTTGKSAQTVPTYTYDLSVATYYQEQ